MNQTIVIKRSTVAGRIPSNLRPGELAVNLADKLLYTAGVTGLTIPLNEQVNYSGQATSPTGSALSNVTIAADGSWTSSSIEIPTTLPASDVYSWAKEQTKPTYTYSEVGALSSNTLWAASETQGGPASSAEKLTNDTIVGGSNRPVYFSNQGVPVPIQYTVNTDVPANAVFTDTTYSNATTSTAGLMSAADKTKLDGAAVVDSTVLTKSTVVSALGF